MHTVVQRIKEIGVRKVLGASVISIVTLLNFLRLIAVATLLASPTAYYAMNRWLTIFAYKINIEWRMFARAGGLAIAIAFLTLSFQSIRAVLMNLAESLRSE